MLVMKLLFTTAVVLLYIVMILMVVALKIDLQSNDKLYEFLMEKLIPLLLFVIFGISVFGVLGTMTCCVISLW